MNTAAPFRITVDALNVESVETATYVDTALTPKTDARMAGATVAITQSALQAGMTLRATATAEPRTP